MLQNNLARMDSANTEKVVNRFTTIEDALQRHESQLASVSTQFHQITTQQDESFIVLANQLKHPTSLLMPADGAAASAASDFQRRQQQRGPSKSREWEFQSATPRNPKAVDPSSPIHHQTPFQRKLPR